jgi:acetyltransferase-like isoleucine patch superfamily enzyme
MKIIPKGYSFINRKIRLLVYELLMSISYFNFIKHTKNTQVPITFHHWWKQKILTHHKGVYWPVHESSKINQYQNIVIGIETSPGYEPGCYIQGIGKVTIGDYTQIAQNVGIISSNHDVYNNHNHILDDVVIGSYCWIGMNSVILPGVHLGDFTIVGAGSVVTKSFSQGFCVIAGNPAKVIRNLDENLCVRYKSEHEYVGFIPLKNFDTFRKNNLWV